MDFPGHVTNWKVVDNGLIYLNTDFQPNPSFQARENGQKPSKMAIFDKKLLIKTSSGQLTKFCQCPSLNHAHYQTLASESKALTRVVIVSSNS